MVRLLSRMHGWTHDFGKGEAGTVTYVAEVATPQLPVSSYHTGVSRLHHRSSIRDFFLSLSSR